MSNLQAAQAKTAALPDPSRLIQPRRQITGISAQLLPFTEAGEVDWDDFRTHVGRTLEAGLTPAVNMDTGYVNLLDEDMRRRVLQQTQEVAGSRSFVAGAFVADQPGAPWRLEAYHQLTNVGTEPLEMVYCYAPAGDVAHWRQELKGTLPRAGGEAPLFPKMPAPNTWTPPDG